MLQAVADVVTGLTCLVILLVLLLIVIRMAAIERSRRARRFRPAAEASLGTYLAGSGTILAMAGRGERALFLAVALEALADLRGDERDRLVDLLVELGFLRDAMLALGARRAVTRRRAAETLAALATPLAVPAVTAALADRDVLVRTTCACTLAETGGEDTVPAIMAVARRDAPAAPGAAASVVLALAQRWPGALAPLFARDSAASIRRIAVTIAADLRLAQLAGQLQACLEDSDDLAASSAHGLGRIGEFSAVAALARLACDSGRAPGVRAAAAAALGAIGDPSSLDVLGRLLVAPEWPVQAAAAEALAHLGDPGSAALRRAASSGRAQAAALAGAALDP
jgi:HEAT repeat protein